MSFTEIELCSDAEINKSQRKKIVKKQNGSETVKAILLGQLGKDPQTGSALNINDLMSEVLLIATEAQKLIGGRVLLLECSDCEKLIACYEKVGFKRLQKGLNGLNQMYMII